MRLLKLSALLVVTSSLLATPAHGFEPVSTLVSIVGGSIFCKMIQCKSVENNVIYIKSPNHEENLKKLKTMREGFKWETDHCRPSAALDDGKQFCFENGKVMIK